MLIGSDIECGTTHFGFFRFNFLIEALGRKKEKIIENN